MKVYHLWLIFSVLCFCSCDQGSEKGNVPQSFLKDQKADAKLRLYAIDSSYLPYLPDTLLKFNSLDSLRSYWMKTRSNLNAFRETKQQTVTDKEPFILADRSASILFDDLMEVLYFRTISRVEKNNRSMGLLSFFSPYSNCISMQERIRLFNSFPENIRSNEIGRKTWSDIQQYSFDKNIGTDFNTFNNIKIRDSNLAETTIGQAFMPLHKYSVIVFGASWCSPCRLEEKQLKHWQPLIDTTLVKIIGLSIDTDEEKWKRYLNEDKLPWDGYLLSGAMNNKMIQQLQFEGVPMNFLINAEGRVLAQNTDIRKILRKIPELNAD